MCSAIRNCLYRAIILLCLLQYSRAAFLRCYNGSLNNYMVTPLTKPLAITPCINNLLPTTFYAFGYQGKVDGPATMAITNAHVEKNKTNFILLDWQEEAKSGFLGIPLGYAVSAVPNARKIGRELGLALVELAKAGISLNDIHLVGHSLGAHLMAYAGRQTRAYGQVVARITGLDPARALFDGTLTFQDGIDRTCAKFVDIVHTDPGGYGTNTSTGTVDIWPNFNGKSGSQPGCPVGNFEMFTPESLCSHDRSWRFYAEAIGAPTTFIAAYGNTYNEWIVNKGRSDNTIYLGDLTSLKAKGDYFLRTNEVPPYAKGLEGSGPYNNAEYVTP